MEGGQLPTPRYALRAAMVGNVLYVAGGSEGSSNLNSILSWHPPSESWQAAGDLKVGRSLYAAVAINSTIIESECSEITSEPSM